MKLNPSKNWIAKILSLLLAIAIWYLIKTTIIANGGFMDKQPRAVPVQVK